MNLNFPEIFTTGSMVKSRTKQLGQINWQQLQGYDDQLIEKEISLLQKRSGGKEKKICQTEGREIYAEY